VATQDELFAEVQRCLEQTKGKTVAKALIGPVVGALTGSARGIVDAFTAPGEALATAKHQVQQDLILETLAKVADAVEEGKALARSETLPWLSIAGSIEAEGVDVGTVTGLEITPDSGAVALDPGTRIVARGKGAQSVTGMSVKSSLGPGVTGFVRLGAADGVQQATARVETGVQCRYCGYQAGLSSTLTVGGEPGPRLCPGCGRALD
jgi:hypothetical protein